MSKCLQMQRKRGNREMDRWEKKKRNQQMGKIETDRAGEGAKKRRQQKYKRPGSGVRSSVVRGTLLREPVAVVSGTASVHVIRQRASGSSPSHFVPPLTASRPDCLTDCWWESEAEREKRGRPLPPFVVSDEEISNVRQLKPMWKHPLKLAFPGGSVRQRVDSSKGWAVFPPLPMYTKTYRRAHTPQQDI